MKRILNNNLLIKLIFSWILLFLPSNINSQEILDEFSETIDKINQDLDSLPSSSIEESIVIEKAVDEISSVINLVEESLNNDDTESAIKILEIVDHAISDISSIVPDEVYSDMSEMKLDNFTEDQMKEIQIITESMNENKQQNMDSLISKMIELNKDGFNTFEFINNLNDIGIDTVKIDINLPKQDEIEKWEKKQWANSYDGSILITNDDSIITDKELEEEVVSLKTLIEKNSLEIQKKETTIIDFESQLSPLNEKLIVLTKQKEELILAHEKRLKENNLINNTSINQAKESLESQYLLEINDLTNQINLIEKESRNINNKISNIDDEINLSNKNIENYNLRILELNNNLGKVKNLGKEKKLEIKKLEESANLFSKEIKVLNDKKNDLIKTANPNDKIQREIYDAEYAKSFVEIPKSVKFLKDKNDNILPFQNISSLSLESFKIPGSFESSGDNIMRVRGALNFKLEDGRISKISIQDGGAMYEKIKAIYNTGNLKATKNINGEYILEIADKNLMPEYYEEVFNKQLEAIKERGEKALSGGCIDTSGNSGRYYCGNDGFANGVPGLSDPIFVDGKVVQSEIPLNRPSRDELDQEFAKTFIKTSNSMNFITDNEGSLLNSVNQADVALKDFSISAAVEDDSGIFQYQGSLKFLDDNVGVKTISMQEGNPEFQKIKAIFASGNLKATKDINDEYILEIADKNLMPEYYEDVFNEVKEALKIRNSTSKLGRDCLDTSGSGTYMCLSNNWNGSIKGVPGLKNPVLIDNEVVEYETAVELYSSKIEDNKNKLVTISNNIEILERETESINNQEINVQKQIKELNEQIELNSNSLIVKNREIKDLQEQLSPISIKLDDVLDQKDQLTKVFNSEKNLIEEELITQEEINIKIGSLKDEYEDSLNKLNKEIDFYDQQTADISKSIELLKTDLDNLKNLEPELNAKLIKVSENLDVVTEAKANLAIASAQRYGLNVNTETIESIKTLENKSIITLDGSSLFRIVDTEALLDNKGDFSIPEGTLSVKGQVYSTGAVRPEKLFSVLELGENNNAFQISFTEKAQDLISKNNSLQGGKQNFQGNTLGSWVLVNATTGEQMSNPLTGHKGSIVCEKSTCGIDGDFGKQAASFGGMYVLENLADENGNVSGLCNDGDCKFNVETLVVLGNNNIENNIFNENGEGFYQDDFTQRQLNEIKSFGITSEQRINAIKYAEENDLDINVLDIPGVDNDSINTQNLAVAYAEENNIFISEEQQTEGGYGKFVTNDFKQTIRSTKLYSGEALSGKTSELAEQTFKVIDGQPVQKTAEEITQSIQNSSNNITEVAKEAATQVAEVAKEVAEIAQEAAQEVAETASTVLTGNDIEALSELANDALGYWVLVDAKTGKQMVNPLSGRTGGSVCTLSHCGAEGDAGKAAAAFGGVYVLDTLADPITGNVAGSCASGDCQYDLGN